LKKKGNYQEALDYYFEALVIREKLIGKTHPDTTNTCGYIGNVYNAQKNYPKAFEYYMKAASIGNNADAQYIVARMYINGKGTDKDEEEAFVWLNKSAKQGYKDSMYGLGWMYGSGKGVEKDYSKAIEWYQKAAEQGYENAYNGLAWNLHLTGRYKEALPWAEKAVAAFPETPYVIDTLASVYQDLGRYDESLEQFELCLKLKKEQNASEERIHETETKIASLKELMKNGGVSEQ
jgi:TPR repeat protein